jgi:epoxide hydrolase-like predicted phosphatase
MSGSRIKCILFDIGDVLIGYNGSGYRKRISELSGYDDKAVGRRLVPLINLLNVGRIKYADFEKEAARRLHIRKSDVEFALFFRKHASVNREVAALIRQLQKRYKIGLLSNINIGSYYHVRRIADLGSFDYLILSCYAHARKPDPAIFRYAVAKTGLRRDQILFIDDMEQNVAAARKFGIGSIRFTGIGTLKSELAKMGVLS